MLRDAVFSGTQVIYANKAANRNAVVNTLSLDDIDTAVEQMNTANVLKFADANGEFYICFVHPHQARALKNALNSIKQYAYPEMIFKGEIWEYNGVRFIETTNTPNGAADPTDSSYAAALNKAATGSLSTPFIYKAALISARAYGWAIAYEVELREDPSYSSFGRKRAIAYYTIQGAGKINNEEIIVIETA
jgi:N4-gp56 family major capsid protein